jgi:hypothetical protein
MFLIFMYLVFGIFISVFSHPKEDHVFGFFARMLLWPAVLVILLVMWLKSLKK